MTEAGRITALAQRIGTEFKTLRSEIGTARAVRVTKSQYAQLTNKDGKTMYLITDWLLNGPLADSFTRDDNATTLGSTSVGGYPWKTYNGTWGVIGGAAYQVTSTAGSIAYQDLQVVEHYVEGRIVTAGTGSMLVGRMTDANNFTALAILSDGTKSVYRNVGGTLSQITLASGSVSGIATGDLLRLSFKGNLCTILQNNSVIATFNDTTLGTKTGFRSDMTSSRFDDYRSDVT